MMSSADLQKCVNLVGELYEGANAAAKKKLVELGYMLSEELKIAKKIDQFNLMDAARSNTAIEVMDTKKLFEDNQRLFNENIMLMKSVKELKKVVDNTLPSFMKQVKVLQTNLQHCIDRMNQFLKIT